MIIRTREQLSAHPHATRLRYLSGCRCLPCRAANSDYAVHRAQAIAKGQSNRIVNAEVARLHILALGKRGMGYKRVADAAGVARSIVAGIRMGRRPNAREESVRSILAVTFKPSMATFVNGASTWKLLDELIAAGFPKRRLAHMLGNVGSDGLQIRRDVITYRNALKVRALYRKLTAEAEVA